MFSAYPWLRCVWIVQTFGLAFQSVFFAMSKFIFMQEIPEPASQKKYVCPYEDNTLFKT